MRLFGTDGIRGAVGKDPITPQSFMQLGWAVAQTLRRALPAGEGGNRVLLGRDTRYSGTMLEAALQAGLQAGGSDVLLLGVMPTPAVAWMSQSLTCDGGMVITASHNPASDNGLKVFDATGDKLGDEMIDQVVGYCSSANGIELAPRCGTAERLSDAPRRYIEYCKGLKPGGLSLAGMKIAVDCANGAMSGIADQLLAELGADVIVLANTPDGNNINVNCGSTSMQTLAAQVVEQRADLGIAFDGDGDRVQMVDHQGLIINGDQLLYVIAMDMLHYPGGCPGVVGTEMSNLGLELALQEQGIKFARAAVGDRFVKALMSKTGWSLGGETSGHIISSELSTTGDGIIAALRVLQALRHRGISLASAVEGLVLHHQHIVNVTGDKNRLEGNESIARALQRVEDDLDEGRIVLRPSGTEPCVRVMVEGKEQKLIRRQAEELADIVRCVIN